MYGYGFTVIVKELARPVRTMDVKAMIHRLAGMSLVLAGIALCYLGWRLENMDLEDQSDSEDGPFSGRGGAIVLVFGAILIFVGLFLLVS